MVPSAWRHGIPLDSFRSGIVGKVTGGHYRIGENVDLGNGNSTLGGSVKYAIVNLGVATNWFVQKHLHVTINVGRTVYRRYGVFDAADRLLLGSTFDAAYFIKATTGINVGTD